MDVEKIIQKAKKAIHVHFVNDALDEAEVGWPSGVITDHDCKAAMCYYAQHFEQESHLQDAVEDAIRKTVRVSRKSSRATK